MAREELRLVCSMCGEEAPEGDPEIHADTFIRRICMRCWPRLRAFMDGEHGAWYQQLRSQIEKELLRESHG